MVRIFLSQSTSLICPSDNIVQNKHHWCTFEAVDKQTAILDIVYLFIVFVIALTLVRYYQILGSYLRQNRYKYFFGGIFKTVYWIISFWVICTSIKVILNLSIYYLYMQPDFNNVNQGPQQDPSLTSPLVIASTVYTLLQFGCAFLLNLLTLLIPYQWMKVMLLSVNENILVTFQLKHMMTKYLKILKLIKIYMKYIRFIFLMLLVSQPFLFYIQQIRCKMSYVNTCCIFVQSIIIVSFYLFVIHVSKVIKKSQIVKVQDIDELKIKLEYAIFFVVSLVRVFWNLQTVILVLEDLKYQPNGHCTNISNDNTYLIVILVLHHGVIHLTPILLFLYMYRPSVLKLRKYQQLLDIDESGSNIEAKQNYKQIVRQFYKSDLDGQIKIPLKNEKVQFS